MIARAQQFGNSQIHECMEHIQTIGGGFNHFYVVCKLPNEETETIYAWYKCEYFQWTRDTSYRHSQVKLLEPLLQCSSGNNHTIFRTQNHVYVYGDNYFKQLTDNDAGRYQEISQHKELFSIDKVVCGETHTIYLSRGTDEDIIYSRGSNSLGQTGHNHSAYHGVKKVEWRRLVRSKRVFNVFCYKNNTIILTEDHEWIVFGEFCNSYDSRSVVFRLNSSLLDVRRIENIHWTNNKRIAITICSVKNRESISSTLIVDPNSHTNMSVKTHNLFGFASDSKIQSFYSDHAIYHCHNKQIEVWNGLHQWCHLAPYSSVISSRPHPCAILETCVIPHSITHHSIRKIHNTEDAMYVLLDTQNTSSHNTDFVQKLHQAQKKQFFFSSSVDIQFS
jgi:hypothetical protein